MLSLPSVKLTHSSLAPPPSLPCSTQNLAARVLNYEARAGVGGGGEGGEGGKGGEGGQDERNASFS